MPYPEGLKELIKKVEETRAARVEKKKNGVEMPMMSLEERADILKYHPDYIDSGRREIRLAPIKVIKLRMKLST